MTKMNLDIKRVENFFVYVLVKSNVKNCKPIIFSENKRKRDME
ncbi:hypothetical protein SDC9_98638 [bioreactor metagenome]|jgi:hypothetical protein|uniref:Uncharacterized protein n=2 Tax=root TaxID=1 RepID=A0A0X1U798_ANAPI|nr:hypothetical protein CPRO_12160 [Anaerotignum propionicum DSM 1682]SHE73966.1 hypothetical protein SAMN02745151_01627 [[Clostridium] propionicum DSM 1682] [Anaerotignum propionicum DSM 1682]